jgi:hypothetical protein
MIAAGWDVAMATHEVFSSLVQVRGTGGHPGLL